MASNKVLVTYKRKRLSSQSHLVHGTNAANLLSKSPNGSPSKKIEFDTCHEELNKECAHCFRYGDFDVNDNLLGCECCSETYHLQCIDPLLKGKWRCSTCSRIHDFTEPSLYHVRESKKTRKNKIIEESDMGPMKLRSHKVLLNIKHAKDSSRKTRSSSAGYSNSKAADSIQMDYSYRKSGSAWKIACVEGNSKYYGTDLDDIRKSGPLCVTSSSERKSSPGCLKVSSMVTLSSDKPVNGLSNDGYPKEKCSTPLITFCRRVKKKQDVNETFTERSSNAEDKQYSSATRSHATEACCIYKGSFQNDSFIKRSIGADVLINHAEGPNVEKEAGPKFKLPGGFVEAKIASDKHEDPLHIGNQQPEHPQSAANVPADPSEQITTASAIDATRDSILVQDDKQSNSAGIGSPIKEELEKKLANVDSDKTTLPYEASKERDHLSDLELCVALPASTCPRNIESHKPSVDVAPEILLESQSSSTPNCPIVVVDEETDGKGKELEWLENLDKVLQEKKKDKDTSPFVQQGGINSGQASYGKAYPMMAQLSCQSPFDQDASIGYMNQKAPLQGRTSLTGEGDPVYGKKQYEENPKKASLCTDFLGLSLPLNPEAHVDSTKDSHIMPSSSSSGVKENVPMHNRQLSWHTMDEPSSLLRHKQIVENVIAGTRMLKEKQGSFLDKFKRYSDDWSEEELDFLWIGVRRHGLGNWNTMLRDPKLRFLESRVAEDLAVRWDIEQKKLVNSTSFQPARLSRPGHSYSPFMDDVLLLKPTGGTHSVGYSAWSHASSEFPVLTAETKLSLGDVYHQKENIPRRNLFHPSSLATGNPLRSESSSTGSFLGSFSIGSVYPKAGFRQQRPIRAQNTRHDWELSTLQQDSSERTTYEHLVGQPACSNNLPHWLKEVLDTGPKPSELLPAASTNAPSGSLLNNDLQLSASFPYHCEPLAPPKDHRRRGILKRKSKSCGGNIGGLRITEMSPSLNEPSLNEPWMGTQAGVLPAPALAMTSQKLTSDIAGSEQNILSNLNEESTDPVGQNDLVVIDSDASSEETISDDQSSRP